MLIIFAGTPLFAAVILQALAQSSHRVVCVYTQPDRPAGRGLKNTQSPVKSRALLHQLPVCQPETLKTVVVQETIASHHADVMVVAAYGMLLPEAVLRIPRYGCINVHPSLLPRWRGAAPIQHTLLAGDTKTGVSIMQMDQGLDTGPILSQCEYLVSMEETTQTLHDRLANLGAQLLLDTLALIEAGRVVPSPQNNAGATYAKKIHKQEALMNWQLPAVQLHNSVRAFNPWPVAYTFWKGLLLRIWRASVLETRPDHLACLPKTMMPGMIVHASSSGIDVLTGDGILRLLELQLQGGVRLSVSDFYNARQCELISGCLLR